ncbi:hypothetical protein Syun_031543 [Stephania yunnanensis]|uniref:Diacylglycerol kinase n=1 Tax=Stephania yunnanensis TaxID=152371 RepID=A0AAP0E577_9MAGN
MDSPSPSSSSGGESSSSSRISVRSSLVDSLRGCGLSGVRVDKEDLRRKILIPEYIRLAMREAIRIRNPNPPPPPPHIADDADSDVDLVDAPIVVFVNSRSGGRLGNVFKERLQQLISDDQVFDLAVVNPPEFVNYGLSCLENLAPLDHCASAVRQKLRIVVAGGDGTVGWVLGSLAQLQRQKREPIPPTGIIPLGTGNDLSRSFGWGGSFPYAWKSAVKRSLYKAATGPLCCLDSWHVMVYTPPGETLDLPHSLKHNEDFDFDQSFDTMESPSNQKTTMELPDKLTCYEGVLYNYFSIGMDAQVAYGFHHLRDEKPHLAQGPIANKLIYSGYSCTQGWFCTPCMSDPSLRGLKNILQLHIKKVNCSEWEKIQFPSSVRAIVALNLHNYGSGRNPWGTPPSEYLEKRGFVEAHADDGLLEIFGLKQGWHASFVMVELINAKHIAQLYEAGNCSCNWICW